MDHTIEQAFFDELEKISGIGPAAGQAAIEALSGAAGGSVGGAITADEGDRTRRAIIAGLAGALAVPASSMIRSALSKRLLRPL